jgi:ABC-type amino acid transport substrate-binding protein
MLDRRQLLGALGLSPFGFAAGASWAKPEPAPKALIASLIDIAPWGRRGANGQASGVYAEIFKGLAKLSDCPIELRLTPIKRAVAEVTANHTQATMMLERADLNEGALNLGTVTTLEIEVWLPAGSKVRQLQDLAGKQVAVLRGPAYHEEFDANNLITKLPVSGARQQLEMMRAGRVYAALGVRQNFLVALRELGWSGEGFAEPLWLGSRRVNLWLSPQMKGSDCARRIGEALVRMRRSGEIDRLMARHVYAEQ